MKSKLLLLALPVLFIGFWLSVDVSKGDYAETRRTLEPEEGCVFMTVMGEQTSTNFNVFKNNENLNNSVRDGLAWMSDAQLPNGGYGAGSHSAQHIKDPHAVPADPATTSMVVQAFLRSGVTLKDSKYGKNLEKANN